MQAIEALTFLIQQADEELSKNSTRYNEHPEQSDHERQLELAASVCQAMLNVALPVARFRCFVSVEEVTGKTKFGLGEFTISATSIDGIKLGIAALQMEALKVHATLWEQRATGADMLNGYQGYTKTLGFRNWLKQIDQFEAAQTLQ